jgi:hypothetical protein
VAHRSSLVVRRRALSIRSIIGAVMHRAVRVGLAVGIALALGTTIAVAAAPPRPPLLTFAGSSSDRSRGANPADVQVASSPGWLLETVNSSIASWSVRGTSVRPREVESLGAFFSSPIIDRRGDELIDARVTYDERSSRFFAVASDVTRGEVELAVSASADPTGGWTVYPLPSAGCADQPRVGTSDAVVVVAADAFSSCTTNAPRLGAEVTVASKSDLLAGVPAPEESQFGPDERFVAITPALSLGPAGVEYMVAAGREGSELDLFALDGPRTSSLPFTVLRLEFPLGRPRPARQPRSPVPVDAGDNRIQNAVWEDGRLWLAATGACPFQSQTCGRVLELAEPGERLLVDSMIALPARRSLFYPAVAPDELGNAIVAFGYSSRSDFPGLAYTYVRPDGAVAPSAVVVRGTGPNESGRFGDYSAASRDATDSRRAWIGTEVGSAAEGPQGWGTAIAEVAVPPQPPAILPAPSGAAASARTAILAAELYPEGQATTYRFQYRLTSAHGTETPAQTLAGSSPPEVVTTQIHGLRPGRAYHFRLVATNAAGTETEADQRVKVPAEPPQVSYPERPALKRGHAMLLRAFVFPNGLRTSVVFHLGRTLSYGRDLRGRSVRATAGRTRVSVRVGRLVRGRVYHLRVTATNARGRAIGGDRSFTY